MPRPRLDTALHNLRAIQLMLGRAKADSTFRNPGVELEDALSITEQIDLRTKVAEGICRSPSDTGLG
ncbi:MAG: hypothetical protein AAGP08_09625 [Pseudomonadota bacterium]